MRSLVTRFRSRTLVSWKFIVLLSIVLQWSLFITEVESGVASPHHSHRHGSPSPNREREDDGMKSVKIFQYGARRLSNWRSIILYLT